MNNGHIEDLPLAFRGALHLVLLYLHYRRLAPYTSALQSTRFVVICFQHYFTHHKTKAANPKAAATAPESPALFAIAAPVKEAGVIDGEDPAPSCDIVTVVPFVFTIDNVGQGVLPAGITIGVRVTISLVEAVPDGQGEMVMVALAL